MEEVTIPSMRNAKIYGYGDGSGYGDG